MNTQAAKLFIELTDEKKRINADLKAVEDKLAECGKTLEASMSKAGVQNVKMNGHTIYLQRDLTASAGGNTEALVAALRKGKYGFILQASPQKLKAWLKEKMFRQDTQTWELDPSKIPANIREILTLDERVSVRCKKA